MAMPATLKAYEFDADGSGTKSRRDATPPAMVQLAGMKIDLVQMDGLLSKLTDHVVDRTPGVLAVLSVKMAHAHYFGSRGPAPRWEQAALASSSEARQVRWAGLLTDPYLSKHAAEYAGRHWAPAAPGSLVDRVMMLAEVHRLRVGFLGFGSNVTTYQRYVSQRWPDVDVAFTWATSLEPLKNNQQAEYLAERIQERRVQILLLNLPVPYQERFIAEHGYAAGAHICVGLGPVCSEALLPHRSRDDQPKGPGSLASQWENRVHRLLHDLPWWALTYLDLRRHGPLFRSVGHLGHKGVKRAGICATDTGT